MLPSTGGLKVLMTTDAVGGVWDYSLELAAQLRERGVETVLACMGPRPRPEQRQTAMKIGVILEESDYHLEWMLDCEEDLTAAGDWLLGLEENYCPDLIHLNGYAQADLPWQAPALVVGHSCVLSWWKAVRRAPAPSEWKPYARRVRRALTGTSCVVAPTFAMLKELHRHYGPLPQGQVIYNGRAAQRYRPLQKEDYIFCAGRLWDEAKNLSALDAAALAGLDWPVRAAGTLQHPCGGTVVPKALEPLGRLETSQMSEQFGKARIYAHPARYEPFGLTPLEAALSGCVLVLGDIPSLRELWQDAALFVDPNDSRELHQTLAELIAHPDRCRSLAVRARERARGYSSDRMGEAYMDLYQELIGQDAQRRAKHGYISNDAVKLGGLG